MTVVGVSPYLRRAAMTLAAVWRTPPHSHRPLTSFKWRFARPLTSFKWRFARPLTSFKWRFARPLTSFKWRFARPLTLPSPPMGARVQISLSLIEGEGRGEGDK